MKIFLPYWPSVRVMTDFPHKRPLLQGFWYSVAPTDALTSHNEVIIWKFFLYYCSFVRGIHQSLVDSSYKGPIMQGGGVFLIDGLSNYWTKSRELSVIWDALMLMCLYSNITAGPLIARFMWPTWGPSGTDRTQVGPMLAPWTLLSGSVITMAVKMCLCRKSWRIYQIFFDLAKVFWSLAVSWCDVYSIIASWNILPPDLATCFMTPSDQ